MFSPPTTNQINHQPHHEIMLHMDHAHFVHQNGQTSYASHCDLTS